MSKLCKGINYAIFLSVASISEYQLLRKQLQNTSLVERFNPLRKDIIGHKTLLFLRVCENDGNL